MEFLTKADALKTRNEQNAAGSKVKFSSRSMWGAFALVAAAALARLIPHPANVTPIIAMALFSGTVFARRPWALVVPILAMFVSDLAIGLHTQMGSVYGSIVLIALIGFSLRKSQKPALVTAASVFSSLIFFAVTNFTVWFQSGMYSKTALGLLECYTAALPFLRNALIGDLAFSGILFGAWALMTRSAPLAAGINRNGR